MPQYNAEGSLLRSVGNSRLILKEGVRTDVTLAKRELLQTYSKGGNSRHTKGEKPQHTPVCEDFENEYNAEVTLGEA